MKWECAILFANVVSLCIPEINDSSSLFFVAELVDKCIGSRIHIIMKNDKEIVGTLLGFDDFVSILVSRRSQRNRSTMLVIQELSVE